MPPDTTPFHSRLTFRMERTLSPVDIIDGPDCDDRDRLLPNLVEETATIGRQMGM